VDDVVRVTETAEQWRRDLGQLLTDEAAWTDLARAGRAAARTRLAWDDVLRGLDEAVAGGEAILRRGPAHQ